MEDDDLPPSRPRIRPIVPILLVPLLVAPMMALAQSPADAGGVSVGQIALLVILLALSGAMSGSETALTALGEWKIRQIREEGRDPSGVFALLEREPTRFITTLLIGNNLVNIAATALVTQISIQLSRDVGFSESLAVGYATGVMTLLVLVFGEITPKSIAVHNPVGFSRVVIRPVWVLSVVLYPVGRAFAWVTTFILRLLRIESTSSPLITENELRLMLRSAEEYGVIEEQEERMIKGIIDLEETVVREVMTPRVDMVAIREDAPLQELLTLVTEHGYSRLPVYAGTIDDIRGVVHARDLLPYLKRPDAFDGAAVGDLVTPAPYVPETQSILNLLRDMRARKLHLAIVVDEFGGTSGLVTLEDVIEEITGEIYDETDEEEEEEIVRDGDGAYLIQGSTHLETVADALSGVIFDDGGEYDTLAGFLADRFGTIPQVGDALEYHDATFEVVEGDERRVTLVRVDLHHERSEGEEDSEGGAVKGNGGTGDDAPSNGASDSAGSVRDRSDGSVRVRRDRENG